MKQRTKVRPLNLPLIICAVMFVPAAYGFSIDVHKDASEAAVNRVNSSLNLDVDPQVIENLRAGAANPDTQVLIHKTDPDLYDYHINNATLANGQFEQSFDLLRELVNDAIELSRGNPRVLEPRHDSAADFIEVVGRACAIDPVGCAPALTRPLAFTNSFNMDPHTEGVPLVALRIRLPRLIQVAEGRLSASDIAALRELRLELKGYEARQLIGHALHLSQDVFAHSNFVELVNGENGPPCGSLESRNPSICGNPVTGVPQQFDDPVVGQFLRLLGSNFAFTLSTFQVSLPSSRYARLQTGFVNGVGACPEFSAANTYDYCHYKGGIHPALNKDEPGEDDSHANHGYARRLAEHMSEILWAHFIHEAGLVSVPLRFNTIRVNEGTQPQSSGSQRLVNVSLNRVSRIRVGFNYQLEPVGQVRIGQSCDPGVDLIARNGRAFIEPGESSTSIPILLCADAEVEPGGEQFQITVGSGVTPAVNRITIADDDRNPVPELIAVSSLAGNALIAPGSTVRIEGRSFVRASEGELDGQELMTRFLSASELHVTLPRQVSSGAHQLRVVTPAGGVSRTVSIRVASFEGPEFSLQTSPTLAPESLSSSTESDTQSTTVFKAFSAADGWSSDRNPRLLGDVNGDGRQDIVGFADDGVYLSLASGSGFDSPRKVLSSFTTNTGGWSVANHPRLLGDVNGDGRDDIVGFASGGVYYSLSTGSGFATPKLALKTSFGYSNGWRVSRHPRLLSDVNNDGRVDIVGFANGGAYVSLSTGTAFAKAYKVSDIYGYSSGWRVDRHPRYMADVTGDGVDDIVGFANAGVYVAVNDGKGRFAPAKQWINAYGYNAGGWRVESTPRLMADVNGDKRADVVGFATGGVYVSFSKGAGFAAPRLMVRDYGLKAGGWQVDRHPRYMADVNGDGRDDIVGFGNAGTFVSLSKGTAFAEPELILSAMGYAQGWQVNTHPRRVADLDNDGKADILGFGPKETQSASAGP